MSMKTYVLSVAGMAIVTALAAILTNEKKYAKTVGGILKLCMLLTLVSPILHFLQQPTTNFSFESSILGQDIAYINNSYSLAVQTQLKNQFGVTARAEIQMQNAKIQRTEIYILDFGMNDKSEHINIITQIAESVKILCDCEEVTVYDGTENTQG